MKLSKVFSDGALFLHSSRLEIRGVAMPGGLVTAKIMRDGETLSQGEATADADGSFLVALATPSASFAPSEIEISDGEETVRLSDILFGELWLAAGQSNMEMANLQQPSWASEMAGKIATKAIRAFNSSRLPNGGDYPIDPVTDTSGWWVRSDNFDKMGSVSALATAFSSDLYDYFAEKSIEMPIGFLNCNRGGTNLESWLPAYAFLRYPAIARRAQDREGWNTKGESNYQQSSAYYNLNTHMHLGVKVRGMLWYQGESNLGGEQSRPIYREMLVALREIYAELFAPTPDAYFPIISSQIYPWQYYERSESRIGYFNRVFSKLGVENPELFPFLPVADLPPIWSYHYGNHPIHPAHKYALGSRFALLCENLCYGRRGQRMPATLVSCVRHGSRLRLTFRDVGRGLYLKDGCIKGLYVRSAKGAYIPAKCEIEGKRVLWVSADGVDRPRHVAYAVSSHETETSLMAGEFPVAPFCTEFSDDCRDVTINRKGWLDLSRDGEFVIESPFGDPYRDAGFKPFFYPCEASTLVYDSVTTGKRGLRIMGDGAEFGAYVKSRVGAELDLENYLSLQILAYNGAKLTPSLVLAYAEKDGGKQTLSIPLASREAGEWGRESFVFDLGSIPKGKIERMTFIFRETTGGSPFVLIEEIKLTPRA